MIIYNAQVGHVIKSRYVSVYCSLWLALDLTGHFLLLRLCPAEIQDTFHGFYCLINVITDVHPYEFSSASIHIFSIPI